MYGFDGLASARSAARQVPDISNQTIHSGMTLKRRLRRAGPDRTGPPVIPVGAWSGRQEDVHRGRLSGNASPVLARLAGLLRELALDGLVALGQLALLPI